MLRYLGLGYQSGFWNWIAVSGPRLAGRLFVTRKANKAKSPSVGVRPPSPRPARNSVVSAPASDADDNQCFAHMVSMSKDTGLTPLPHRECTEVFATEVRLLTPDLLASHLPDSYDVHGIKLRSTQSDVYHRWSV